MTGSPVISVQGAEKVFDTGLRALAGIDLTVEDKSFVTLIGPSGCGKSTLLRLIAGLAAPSKGRVERTSQRLGYVFQEPTLMPWARVVANVRLPLDLAGVDRTEADHRAKAALDRLGLAGFERAYPRELSGGMKMRVSIARALVPEPDLLLMDEPFGALDEFTRHGLDHDLTRLSVERGLTTIFVTHSIYEAVFVSTRVVLMAARPGRIVEQLDIDEPMPRDPAFRESPRFLDLCRHLSSALAAASTPEAA